uniref:Ribonuclease H1 n=1 Tax=Plectus sambesii TaxID=2011161 RepID=A0A914WW76_9BILA
MRSLADTSRVSTVLGQNAKNRSAISFHLYRILSYVVIFKFGGARYKKFESEEEALNFIAENKVGAAASKKKDSTSDLKRKRSAPDDDDDDEDDDDDDDDDEDEDEPKERSKVAKVSDDKPSKSKRSREDVFDETDAVVVYTDGACAGNGQKGAVGGIGVYWGIDSPHNVAEPLVGVQTNNRAEYTAVSTALRQAISQGHKKVILRTDSNLLINSMTKWIAGWKKKGWKTATGGAVKNRPELEEIDGLMQKIKVKFEHVRGHQGIFGNEEADRLAREGAKKGMIRK